MSCSRLKCASQFLVVAALAALPVTAPAQSIEQLTDYRIGAAGPASITSDGSTIWTSGSFDYGGNPLGTHQVLKIDRATGTGTQVTSLIHGVVPLALDLTIKGLVSVSDDGSWVAFVAISDPLGTNPDRSSELFVMDGTGGQLAQLTNTPGPNAGSVTSLSIAGSGNRIAYTSNCDHVPGMNPLNRENVFIVDRTGANLAQLTDLPAATFAGGVTISDDGTKVGFSFNGNLGDLDGDGTDDNDDFSYEVFTILNDGTGLRQVTDGDGWDSVAPVISGDGTKIVYQSNDDPSGATGGNNKNQDEIFIIDWNGSSNWRQLTDSKSNVLNAEPAAFSPWISDVDPDGNGHIVVFASTHATSSLNNDGNGEIYRIRSDGTQFRLVTDSSFSDGSSLPVISGDGTTIVLYSLDDLDGTANGRDNDDLSPELFAVDDSDDNADGTQNVGAVQLTAGLIALNRMPKITPDGSKVAFVSEADFDGSDADRGGEIYLMNSDGTGRTQVTNLFTGGIEDHDLSADATRVVFASDSDPDGSNADLGVELFFINADGSGLERVTDGTLRDKRAFNPVFNRAGTFVYFDWNGNDSGNNTDNNREIWRVNTSAPYVLQLLTNSVIGELNQEPRVSVDGNWIVFESTEDFDSDGTGRWQVVRAAATGGSETLVCTSPDFDCVDPDISSDGAVVVFSSNADLVPGSNPESNFELFRYDVGTAAITQLTSEIRGASVGPRFSGNDQWIYFQTNASIFESDPDNHFHVARLNVATGAIERVGALVGGLPSPPEPDDTGNVAVFSSSGNPILQNWDFADEIFIVRQDVPAGGVHAIALSPGPAPTTVTIPQWVSGPMRYDILRGSIADLQVLGGDVSLGAAVCIENDSLDLDTAGNEDLADPAPGQGFFYLWRGDSGPGVVNSWGTSSSGLERNPQPGTGCLPN